MKPSFDKLPKYLQERVDEIEYCGKGELIDDCVAIVYTKSPWVMLGEMSDVPVLNHKEMVYFLENAEKEVA